MKHSPFKCPDDNTKADSGLAELGEKIIISDIVLASNLCTLVKVTEWANRFSEGHNVNGVFFNESSL